MHFRYSIQAISIASSGALEVESNYSAGLLIDTGKYGDVVIPLAAYTSSSQPSIATDILRVVDKWKGKQEPIKARSQIDPPVLVPDTNVGIKDVLKSVDGWRGFTWPFTVPSCAP